MLQDKIPVGLHDFTKLVEEAMILNQFEALFSGTVKDLIYKMR